MKSIFDLFMIVVVWLLHSIVSQIHVHAPREGEITNDFWQLVR